VGVEYDAQGKPETFIVSDTGDGQCCSRIPAARFASSLKPKMTTTTEALWRPRAP
jgi:hypothetical protein